MTLAAIRPHSSELQGEVVRLEDPTTVPVDVLPPTLDSQRTQETSAKVDYRAIDLQTLSAVHNLVDRALFDADGTPFSRDIRRQTLHDVDGMIGLIFPDFNEAQCATIVDDMVVDLTVHEQEHLSENPERDRWVAKAVRGVLDSAGVGHPAAA